MIGRSATSKFRWEFAIYSWANLRPYLAFTANPFQENLAFCLRTLCYFLEIVVKGDEKFSTTAKMCTFEGSEWFWIDSKWVWMTTLRSIWNHSKQLPNWWITPFWKNSTYIHTTDSKGGSFFQKVWFRFSNLQISKKKCSKKLSWTWNLNFPPITLYCYWRKI